MNKVLTGDVREKLLEIPDGSIQMCVTSPPYWGLRDYGHPGQIGLEKTPEEYVAIMVEVFREVRRVLKKDGTLWLNLGDSYAGSGMGAANYPESASEKQLSNHGSTTAKGRGGYVPPGLKPKDLVGIPWMVAFALRFDGWYLRSDIIWHKPNSMPESVTDRPTKAHEYIFLLTKSAKYYYDADAIAEPVVASTLAEIEAGYAGEQTKDYAAAGAQNPSDVKRRIIEGKRKRVFGGANKHDGYRTRIHSGKEWNPKMGGGGSSFAGHSGNLKANGEPICEPTRNKRSVWTVTTKGFAGAHFATFPPDLILPCIRAGSKEGDTVLDPFVGSGTTLEVAERLGRNSIGIELNEKYVREIIEPRMAKVNPLFSVEPANTIV